jgi:hypothetical protein
VLHAFGVLTYEIKASQGPGRPSRQWSIADPNTIENFMKAAVAFRKALG